MLTRIRAVWMSALLILVMTAACSEDSMPVEGQPAAPSTSTTRTPDASTTTTIPAIEDTLPTATDLYPGVELLAVEVAVALGCETLVPGEHKIVETDFNYDCAGSPEGSDGFFIYLFDSLDQADRFMSFYSPHQQVGNEHWIVSGHFDDIDSTASSIAGLTLQRSAALGEPVRALTRAEQEVLYNEAVDHSVRGAPWFALYLLDAIVDDGDHGDPELASLRAGAMATKGRVLLGLDLTGDAIALWTETVDEYSDSESGGARTAAAESAFLIGVVIGLDGVDSTEHDEAKTFFDEAITYFDTAIQIAETVPSAISDSTRPDAMFWKATALNMTGRSDEAKGILQEIVDQYAESSDPAVDAIVADAIAFLGEIEQQ